MIDPDLLPRSRTRVLHVVQNLNYGGMERLMFDLIRSLDKDEFESHVLVLQYVGRFGKDLEEHSAISVAGRMGPLSMLWPASLAAEMRRIAPDVIHCHSGVWHKAAAAARLAGVRRVIFTEHGRSYPDPWLARFFDHLASTRADAVVAVSQPVADHLSRRVRVDAHKLHVVPNGVDTTRFAELADTGVIRSEFNLAHDQPIIGSVGRLEPVKGFEVMLRAFGLLLQEPPPGPRPVLLIAGDGSARGQLEALVRELGLEGSVLLPGWRDDLEHLYGSFSVFSMSSFSEGTSISLLEAMSAGLCPVVTDVGGNRQVLGAALHHRLVPSADPVALARALRDALERTGARIADGAVARARATAEYSLRSMVARYESLYRNED